LLIFFQKLPISETRGVYAAREKSKIKSQLLVSDRYSPPVYGYQAARNASLHVQDLTGDQRSTIGNSVQQKPRSLFPNSGCLMLATSY